MIPPKTDPFQWIGPQTGPNNGGFNPLFLIRAVNGFLPMGKEKALAKMEQRVRRGFVGERGLFLVLRCLFEIPKPPGYMPPMLIGAPNPPEPSNQRVVPRFPLVLMDDIPILMVHGYILGGIAQSPLDHIAYFRQHGNLRTRPLVPSSRPLDIVGRLEASSEWLYGHPYQGIGGTGEKMTILKDRQEGRCELCAQLLRLVASVYPMKPFDEPGDALLQKAVREVGQMRLRWDTDRNDYVRV